MGAGYPGLFCFLQTLAWVIVPNLPCQVAGVTVCEAYAWGFGKTLHSWENFPNSSCVVEEQENFSSFLCPHKKISLWAKGFGLLLN
jgi:hypothetical protein